MAIITVNEYDTFNDLPSPVDNQSQISLAIDLATAMIEGKTGGRTFVIADNPSPVDTVETLDGKKSPRLWTKNAPITAVSMLEYWDGTAWREFDAVTYPYAFKPSSNCIYFTNGHNFTEGHQNIRVTFEYGFNTDYPEDLKLACFQIAKYILDEADHQGIISQQDVEQKFIYRRSWGESNFPEVGAMLMHRYKTVW